MSVIVKLGKAGKRALKRVLPAPVSHISYTRRIERVCTSKRICAMTFDDGPMDLPASPDRFGGRSLTDLLLDTLAEYGARGTFDVIGDTSENYPDQAGKPGSPAWGGIRYDHYPDIKKDSRGGAVHNDRLIRRILAEGHQLTNHGYRHVLFGKKAVIYGKRRYLGSFEAVRADLDRLHTLIREKYGYEMTMGRPPHYVDKVEKGLTAYDVYDALGYQYLAASFDGAGWLPSTLSDLEAAFEAEVRAMTEPLKKALEQDPDCLCGQIIFQKDGYNMARRTPVACGLGQQLALLREYGYRVVTVEELLNESPFADLGREDPDFEKLNRLQRTRALVYSDNRLRPDRPMTQGELAMLLAPREETVGRRLAMIRNEAFSSGKSNGLQPGKRDRNNKTASGKKVHAYAGALSWCVEQGLLPADASPDAPVTALPASLFEPVSDFTRRSVCRAFRL